MKRVVITTVFFLLLLILIAVTVYGKRGLIQMVRLQEELHEIQNSNAALETENARLRIEIDQLKNDLRYLEELIRNELGLAKEDELIYRPENKN